MDQKNAQLPYLEKVQHPNEKSRAKNFFTKVIRAEVYLHVKKKKIGGLWHFKHSVKIMSETGKNVEVRATNLTSGLMTNK